MNANARLSNFLLGVIAVCLCLIVLDLYGVHGSAHAQTRAGDPDTSRVEVSNLPLPVELVAREPLRVQLYYDDAGSWRPVNLDAGSLVVRPLR